MGLPGKVDRTPSRRERPFPRLAKPVRRRLVPQVGDRVPALRYPGRPLAPVYPQDRGAERRELGREKEVCHVFQLVAPASGRPPPVEKRLQGGPPAPPRQGLAVVVDEEPPSLTKVRQTFRYVAKVEAKKRKCKQNKVVLIWYGPCLSVRHFHSSVRHFGRIKM